MGKSDASQIRKIAPYPPLMDHMRNLVGEEMLFHLALTGWVSTERQWHQDDYLNPPHVNSCYAAVWIALDDIHEDSGPFEYVPGSDRWPLLRGETVRSYMTAEELRDYDAWPTISEGIVVPAIEREIQKTGLPITKFIAKRGDVLIWHGRLLGEE
jgi:ectoine hydroxylase-related dioxygenase (phytanoyl-CoA dioxygenase family)